MLNSLWFIITVSLFDSFSTTQQIVIFVLILTTAHPVKNALSYLAGLMSAYFICGLIGYATLDPLNKLIAAYFHPSVSATDHYRMQIIMGIVFTAIGVIYYLKKRNTTRPELESLFITRLEHMSKLAAFVIGVVLSVTGFPLSLPYIAALEKFALMKMSLPDVVTGVALYNVFYALPMMVILVLYLFAGAAKGEDSERRLKERAGRLNLRLTSAMFVGLGLVCVADGLTYFLQGAPIFKTLYF